MGAESRWLCIYAGRCVGVMTVTQRSRTMKEGFLVSPRVHLLPPRSWKLLWMFWVVVLASLCWHFGEFPDLEGQLFEPHTGISLSWVPNSRLKPIIHGWTLSSWPLAICLRSVSHLASTNGHAQVKSPHLCGFKWLFLLYKRSQTTQTSLCSPTLSQENFSQLFFMISN